MVENSNLIDIYLNNNDLPQNSSLPIQLTTTSLAILFPDITSLGSDKGVYVRARIPEKDG